MISVTKLKRMRMRLRMRMRMEMRMGMKMMSEKRKTKKTIKPLDSDAHLPDGDMADRIHIFPRMSSSSPHQPSPMTHTPSLNP
ncbi:hypothetical protein CRG98_009307 [Punica granatum]|uniref:Uncharacterized protein n=1 Tax=Punica granatum TaxID=22663 RepID=A0A2I0KPA0_PUNGR|nr:hypothetical protein CRG98_009307 [Punica granatum]